MIPVPADKRQLAQVIMDRVEAELEEGDDGCAGYDADLEDEGVWLRHDESINMEHAEVLVRALVEELDLPGIHVCEWADHCSRPRVDEFGGGAFAVKKGLPTVWIAAGEEARKQMLQLESAEVTVNEPVRFSSAISDILRRIEGREVTKVMASTQYGMGFIIVDQGRKADVAGILYRNDHLSHAERQLIADAVNQRITPPGKTGGLPEPDTL